MRQLAVLANGPSPYHAHFLRRLAEELDGVRVHALFTHAGTFQPWSAPPPAGVLERSFAEPVELGGASRGRLLRSSYRTGGRILEYLETQDIDALICQGYDQLALVRTLIGCMRRGLPVFLRGDSNAADDDANPPWKRAAKGAALRPLLRRLTGVMAVGTAGTAYYRRYGVPPERVHLVPLEPDYEAIRQVDPDAIRDLRESEGFDPSRRRILYCGRMAPVKRVDLLLRAFESLARRRGNWDLVLAGDGPLRSELEAGVPAAIASRVRWMGFRDVREIRALYHCCDVLALPSDREPWALVVNEAMGAGLVVVVSDVVGAGRDMVEPGTNGTVFRRGDLGDLERALLEATDEARLPALRAAVAPLLERWRRRADPVEGVRVALREAGIVV